MGIRNYCNTSKQDNVKNTRLLALAGRLEATPDTEGATMNSTSCWLTKGRERENLKLDESCISNSKLEISDWTDYRADWPVQFEISSFEFEMQDSSNFKFPLSLP